MRGRKPSFRITLSPEERAQLEQWQRATSIPVGLVRRGKAVLLLADGTPVKDVMLRCEMTGKTVRKWARRFGEHRLAGLADLPRPGRPPVFSPRSRLPPGQDGL